jgi:hypothetical protein
MEKLRCRQLEPCESRGSRTVLRGALSEILGVYSPECLVSNVLGSRYEIEQPDP